MDILRKNSNTEGFYEKPLRERVKDCGYSLELAQILMYDADKPVPALLRLKLAAIIIKILGNPLNAKNAGINYYESFLKFIVVFFKNDLSLDTDLIYIELSIHLFIIISETNFTCSNFDVSRREELINLFIRKYINTNFNKPLLARLVVCALNGPYAMNLINFESENIMNLITHYGVYYHRCRK